MHHQNRTRMALNIDLAVFSKLETAEGKLNVDVLRAEDGLRARECPSGHHRYR